MYISRIHTLHAPDTGTLVLCLFLASTNLQLYHLLSSMTSLYQSDPRLQLSHNPELSLLPLLLPTPTPWLRKLTILPPPGMSGSLFTGVLANGYGPPPGVSFSDPVMVRDVAVEEARVQFGFVILFYMTSLPSKPIKPILY